MPDVPPEAITAAADAMIADYPVKAETLRRLAVTALEAAYPHIRAAIYAELGNDHYVIFTEDGWMTEHSVECRLSGHMHECDYHEAVSRIADDFDPDMAGRWRIDGIDSEGLPALVRADLIGGDHDG